MASQEKEESTRRSMLPQMNTSRKLQTAVGVGRNQNDQMSTTDQSSRQTKLYAASMPSGLGRSRTIQRLGPLDHITEPTRQRGTSMNVEVKAPRGSGIVAPRSDYYRTPSRKASESTVHVAGRPANLAAIQSHQSTSEIRSSEPHTIKVLDHAKTTSATKQAPPESTIQRYGRSSSKQLSAGTIPSINIQPLKQDQRPAFSTLQQHFTPKKTNQSATTWSMAPPSTKQDADYPFPGGTGRLQMELAQLHTLHRTSMTIQAQWEKSAERILQHRYQILSKQHTELKEIACESQALINQSALVAWCQHVSDTEIATKVQLLSRCLVEICSILSSDGKLSRVVRLFEAWSDRASWVRGTRHQSTHGNSQGLEFVESIGDSWIAEVDILNKKLSSISRELESLGRVREGSSINRVLVMLRSITSSIQGELDLIRSIEHEVIVQETSWIQDVIENLADHVDNNIDAMATLYKGIWNDEE